MKGLQPLASLVAAWLLLLGGGCLPDFSAFSEIDPPTDAGFETSGDGERDEFRPGAVDQRCASTWSEIGASAEPTCLGRRLVSLGPIDGCRDLAMARLESGDIMIVASDAPDADRGSIRTIQLPPDRPEHAEPGPSLEPEAGIAAVDLAVESIGNNHLRVAAWRRAPVGNAVELWDVGSEFEGPTTIASGVGPDGAVDLVTEGMTTLAVAWHDNETGEASVRARRHPEDPFPEAVHTLREGGLPNPGGVALVRAYGGALHAAFPYRLANGGMAPAYTFLGADTWTVSRTLDNVSFEHDRRSGVGLDITMNQTGAVIAYLDWRGGHGEVRTAEVRSTTLPTEVRTVAMGLAPPSAPEDHALAIASDVAGLLHLVFAVGGAERTALEYHHQTRSENDVVWLRDTIARMHAPSQNVLVALWVGNDRRPHIVFYDPEDRELRYATVFE